MFIDRQWRNLQLRKDAGFGHDRNSPPKMGELVRFCVACPQPGKNLKKNWYKEKAQWVFISF